MLINHSDAMDYIKNCDDVYILTHQSPDGDTIGAGFSLHYALKYLGKRSKVVCSDPLPKRYGYMYADYIDCDFTPKCIIAVDIADWQLLGNLSQLYKDSVNLCIDHHISNILYAQQTLLRADASATCEVMYDLITQMNIPINDVMAKCIYTGIATDTGCFKFENTTPHSHEIAANLMKSHDLKYAALNRILFDVKSAARIKLEVALINAMETYLDNKCTMITITKDFLNSLNIDSAELEGVTSVAMQVEDVEVGVLIKEREHNVYKISMRSANNVNVSDICSKLGGGGHVKAAGCLIKAPLEEVKKLVVHAISQALEKPE